MMYGKWFSILSLFVIAALILSACQPIAAPSAATEPPPPHGLRFDAPPYAVDGPYAVGVRYFTIPAVGENDRELTATVWYPAQQPESATPKMVYEQQFAPGQFPPFSVFGNAVLDAPPNASGAPYPLVVYSHSHWSMGQEVPYFTEHLASRGFVVISVDHEDNWSTDLGPMAYESVIRRPQEVTRQIDFAETLGASDGDLAGMIDTKKVGAAGWSMGAVTSLAAAGARLDLATLRAWCEENSAYKEAYSWACVDILDHEAEMADFAGLEEAPTGLWPATQDERIAAAVRLSGSLIMLGSDGLASVAVPVLLMHGGGEEAADPGAQMGDPYASVGSEQKAEVVFDHGGHLLFDSSCDDNPGMAAMGFPMFCTDPVWDMDRAHDLINHFAAAFLLAELKGDAEAATALAPENVAFPGIQYESTGYGAAAAPESLLDDATVAKIEGIVQKAMTDYPAPGFELCIVKDGQVAYSNGFGMADVAENRPATPQSLQIHASVSKPLVAMAVMQLAEQGMIDLDAPVTDYLPYFTMADERYKEITVRMLLGHRSGMADWWPPSWPEPLDPAMNPLEQAVRGLGEVELLFAPDEAWSYSGFGYITLGAVIAAVTGQPFESYMAQQWLEPMGMTNSTFITEDVDPALRMTAHKSGVDGKATPTEIVCDARNAPACNLWSNCEDMVKWAQLMLNKGEIDGERLLQPESIDAMWTPTSETGWLEMMGPWYGSPIANYGLGWLLGETDGHRFVGHPGGIEGANSQILLAPDDGLAVIMMDNWLDLAAVPAYPASNAATDVMYTLLGIEPQ